jgi:hypothetical protein
MKPHFPRNTMPRWQRRLLDGTVWLLTASGLLWLSVHQWGWPTMARAQMEGLPSPWEPWLMKLHGAAVIAMLFVAGRVSATHVMRGWRLHRGRRSGLVMLLGLALLTLTGYALYYLVPEDWRDPTGWVHTGVGAAWALGLLWHRRDRALST